MNEEQLTSKIFLIAVIILLALGGVCLMHTNDKLSARLAQFERCYYHQGKYYDYE